MKTEILNVPFDTLTNKESLNKLLVHLNEDKNHIVITPNPEIVIEANRDNDFMKIIKEADLVIPDGIGVVIASKLNKIKIKERVAGYDLTQNLFEKIKKTGHTVYFFGGAKGVALIAKEKMELMHKGLKIIGVSDGYFNEEREKIIIEEIKKLKPDILLIGLGAPKQEKWIYKNKDILPVKVSICVGGSFDGMSGTVKRAPVIFQKMGLEWFYRLIKQPSRIIRMMRLPLFMILVIKNKIIGVRK